MTDRELEGLVDGAFNEFRGSARRYVTAPPVSVLHRTLRRRRTAQRVTGVALAGLVAIGTLQVGHGLVPGSGPADPNASVGTRSGADRTPGSVAAPVGPSASTGPSAWTGPPASTAGPGSAPAVGSARSSSRTSPAPAGAALAVSVSDLTLAPASSDGRREGGLMVRVINGGPATVPGVRVTVWTPAGIRLTGALGCALSPGGCTMAAVAPGETVAIRLTVMAEPGAGPPSDASSRRVRIEATGGAVRDPDPGDDTATYLIRW